MLEQIKGQSGRVLLAGLAGITAGIITGLLMAPEAGKNTRQNFSKSALDLNQNLQKALKKINNPTSGIGTMHKDKSS